MRKKVPKHACRSSNLSCFSKVVIVLSAGILLNFAWFASPGVFSWFSHENSAVGKASVAASPIKSASVESGIYINETYSSVNTVSSTDVKTISTAGSTTVRSVSSTKSTKSDYPKNLVLKKEDGAAGEPIVYFSVEGPAAQYIKSMNPVKLSEKSEYYDKSSNSYKIPIHIAVNFQQWLDLIGKKDIEDDINGTITVKYLNNFISYPVDITLHPSYLRKAAGMIQDSNRAQSIAAQPKSGIIQSGKDELNREITGALLNVAKFNEWKSVELPKQQLQTTGTVIVPTLELTPGQNSIMDVIVPNLRGFIDYIYGCIKYLQDQVVKKDEQINRLNAELKKEKEINTALQGSISAMGAEMSKLHEQLSSQNKTVTGQQPVDKKENGGTTNGSTSGSANGTTQGQTNDTTQGTTNNGTSGITNANTQGTTNGSTQETTNNSTSGTGNGSTQTTTGDGTSGTTNSNTQATTNNSTPSAADGNTPGATNSTPGTATDTTQEQTNGNTQGTTNNSTSGTTNGSTQETTNNNTSGTENGSTQVTTGDGTSGTTNSNTQGTTNNSSSCAANANTSGSTNSSTPGTANGTTQGQTNDTSQGTTNSSQ